MNKVYTFVITVILVLTVFLSSAGAAPVYEENVAPHAVVLIDVLSGEVLFEKNADERIRPASTTKIMTLIVALEHASLDDTVTVGPEGDWSGSGYSLMGTRNGERISMKDLLYGMMLVSGNDAAAAIAMHVGGTLEGFADMMNAKAQELGMTSSHFVNPHGADEDGHYITARDMAKLTRYVIQNETFMKIADTTSYDLKETNRNKARTIENTNKLILKEDPEYYPYANGIKTGSTPLAMRCLVSSAEKDGMQLACLVYGDETSDGIHRWPVSRSLFDFGFINYETVNVQTLIDAAEPISVEINDENIKNEQPALLKLKAVAKDGEYKTLEKSIATSAKEKGLIVNIELYQGETLSAPVNEGEVVGVATYSTVDNQIVCSAELIVAQGTSVSDEWEPNIKPIESSTDEPKASSGSSWLWYIVGGLVIAAVALTVYVYIMRRKAHIKRATRRRARKNYARRPNR